MFTTYYTTIPVYRNNSRVTKYVWMAVIDMIPVRYLYTEAIDEMYVYQESGRSVHLVQLQANVFFPRKKNISKRTQTSFFYAL